MTTLDFGPTTSSLAAIVRGVGDDQLDGPTPNAGRSVGDLLDHIGGLALAFTAAARKEEPPGGGNPSADADALPEDWRTEIPDRLAALAESWRDPAAYEGSTQAGPIEMPADEAALVALDEVTVHAWDLAVATGQAYDADPAAVEACAQFVAAFEGPRDGGLFGPPVAVPDSAPALDRLIGATGRDPTGCRRDPGSRPDQRGRRRRPRGRPSAAGPRRSRGARGLHVAAAARPGTVERLAAELVAELE